MRKSNVPSKKAKANKSKISNKKSRYFDVAASADPNPSSIHAAGLVAKSSLEDARAKIASILSARLSEIVFTSGGTEANNLAIIGFCKAITKKERIVPHIITTNIEHSSVLEIVRALTEEGSIKSTIVPVEENGIIDVVKLKKSILPETRLISVMYANNEIGTIQPVSEISKMLRHVKKHTGQQIYLHTDAVQAVSTLPLNIEKLGVDLLTLSGTKVPKARGAGVLYIKSGTPVLPVFYGGDQENGLRPGTENVNAIAALASGVVKMRKDIDTKKMSKVRDYFFRKVTSKKIFTDCGVLINGDRVDRLVNNINITFPKIPSDILVLELSSRGFMTSSKSACQSSHKEGSYVIHAIRPEVAKDIGGLRISFDGNASTKDMDDILSALEKILFKLKDWY